MYCAYCAASTMARHNTVSTASTLQIQASVYELLTKLLKKVRVGIVRKSLNCTLCNAREKRSLLSFCFVFHRKYQRAAAVSSWCQTDGEYQKSKDNNNTFQFVTLFIIVNIFIETPTNAAITIIGPPSELRNCCFLGLCSTQTQSLPAKLRYI